MTSRPLIMMALLASATALSACGKTGELQQPAPLFGAEAKADYDAKQAAEAEARAARRADPQPIPTDPTSQPLTQAPYSQTIPGALGPPAGALPSPGTPGAQ